MLLRGNFADPFAAVLCRSHAISESVPYLENRQTAQKIGAQRIFRFWQ
jgi:hypothetical protein